ncbi:MAG: hypothetical protein AB1626_00125 [Candidatus Micrarchaeota archaeon]
MARSLEEILSVSSENRRVLTPEELEVWQAFFGARLAAALHYEHEEVSKSKNVVHLNQFLVKCINEGRLDYGDTMRRIKNPLYFKECAITEARNTVAAAKAYDKTVNETRLRELIAAIHPRLVEHAEKILER